MAVNIKNANFFKYLQEAFRHKLFRDKGATSFKYLDYNLPYKSIGSIKGIFDYARKVLPSFYTNEFPNTEEGNLEMAKKVLEKLDKRQDLELEKSFNPPAISAEHEQLIAEAQAASQQATVGQEAPAATTGGQGLPFTPSVSSAPRMARIIHDIPHVPELETPKSELVAANKSGVVREAGDPSKLVKATRSGVVKEAPPSKIYIPPNRSGVPTGEHLIPSSVPQRFSWRGFKMPTSFINAAKNFTSGLGRSFYRNIGSRIGLNSLVNGAFNLIGRAGGSLGAMGGRPGIPSGGIFGSARRIIPGRNRLGFMSRFSKTSLKGFGTGKKVALAFSLFGAFFGFSLISAVFLPNQTTPIASAANLLDYTIPFRDASVIPLDIKDQVKASWPNAKLENWDTIIQKSVAALWNPAFVLTLWIEETGASQTTVVRNGGSGVPTPAGDLTLGHLGCAPTEDQTIDESLNCLFKNFNSFSNNQFAEFMARYSGGPTNNPFANNPNFPNGIKFWYSRLVPSGPGALTFIPQSVSYVLNRGSGIVSCPVNSPTIGTGSKDTPGGHCSADYQISYPCASPDVTGRASAIDLQSADRTVFLPYLNGEKVTWTINESGTAINETEGGGFALAATAQSKGNSYKIRFVHINTPSLNVGDSAESGTDVSTYITTANHVHVTLQENGEFKPADLYFNLCK